MKKMDLFLLLLLMVLPMGIFPTAQEKTDTIDCEIWVTLDPAQKMLHGRETIRWTNTSRDAIPDFWFHLYWNAFKNERSALMTEALHDEPSGTFHGDTKVKDGDWGSSPSRSISHHWPYSSRCSEHHWESSAAKRRPSGRR